MNSESNKLSSTAMDEAEPQAGGSPAPVFLVALFALLVFWGFVYLENHGGGFDGHVYSPYSSYAALDADQPPHVVDPKVLGLRIFSANCTPCHQASGMGLPGQFPPVAGSEWINAKSPNRIIRAVLNGLTGPIKVKEQSFNNTMVPWKDALNDDQIAAVLTFVRQDKDWGNDAPVVTPEQVKAIRAKIKSHDGPFSPDELLKLPETE